MDIKQLAAPSRVDEIEWRVGRAGTNAKGPWAQILAYPTARSVMNRLDACVGPMNWKVSYHPWECGKTGVLARLEIYYDEEWVAKEDGAEQSDIESVKGGFSDALKRAAVAWGMFRDLYRLGTTWAEFSDRGKHSAKIDGKYYKWDPPQSALDALEGDWKSHFTGSDPVGQKPSEPERAGLSEAEVVEYLIPMLDCLTASHPDAWERKTTSDVFESLRKAALEKREPFTADYVKAALERFREVAST